MKNLTSFRRTATLFGLAGAFLLSTPCQALNFTWSFVNNTAAPGWANLGATGDIIGGTVLNLVEGGNWAGVTVTFDTVNGVAPAGPIGPQVFSGGWFVVTGGAISNFSYSTSNGVAAIQLSPTSSKVSDSGFTQKYGGGQTTFAPLSVPDGGITLILLGLGIAGLAIVRRKLS